jgi:nucleotide-binding universal stress UspA family protein
VISLAYDATINGDWVSRYAVRAATHHPSRRLKLLHVDEGRLSPAALDEKIAQVAWQCEVASVTLEVEVLPLKQSAFATLHRAIPTGNDSFLICATRPQSGQRGYLAGSIGEQLLKQGLRHVLAVHVVQPGVLGAPHDALLPVSGHPRGVASALPILRLVTRELSRLHILHVKQVGRWRYRRLTHEATERLRRFGIEYCRRIEQELTEILEPGAGLADCHAVVSDDVAKEIIIHATRLRSELILLGASNRSLSERFMYGNPIEQVLLSAPCDVAIYRGLE